MALHHELPIYKAAFDLLGLAVDLTRNIPRDFKRQPGELRRRARPEDRPAERRQQSVADDGLRAERQHGARRRAAVRRCASFGRPHCTNAPGLALTGASIGRCKARIKRLSRLGLRGQADPLRSTGALVVPKKVTHPGAVAFLVEARSDNRAMPVKPATAPRMRYQQQGRQPMQLKVKRLHPDAILPKYQTAGAACFDLHAIDYGENDVKPRVPQLFRTGLSFEVPPGHVMLVFSRSGHGFNVDTRLANCVGVIDSDYRGEVAVKLTRDNTTNPAWLTVRPGDRIAQAMILPIPLVEIVEADGLSETARGANGFGSTGQ